MRGFCSFIGQMNHPSVGPQTTNTQSHETFLPSSQLKRKKRSSPREFAPASPAPQPLDSNPTHGFKLKDTLGGQAFSASEAVNVHHETTMIACAFLLQRQKQPDVGLTGFVQIFRSAYQMANHTFKSDIAHIALIASFLENTGVDPAIQYAFSKSASTDKFFKSLMVQNSAEGVAYITVTPEDVKYAVPETEESFVEAGVVACTLVDPYTTSVNNYLVQQFQLPEDTDDEKVAEYVETVVTKTHFIAPAENTTYSVQGSLPGMLQEEPVPNGDTGNLTLGVMELDRMMGDTKTYCLVQNSPISAAHDPYREGSYPASRLIPMGKADGPPSFTFCSYVDGFDEVRDRYYRLSQFYSKAAKSYKDEMTVMDRLTNPYKDARDLALRQPYCDRFEGRQLTFYQKGMSSALEIGMYHNHLHIANISTFTTARRDGYQGEAFIIDPRTFTCLVLSAELLEFLRPPNIEGSVRVPIRTGTKGANLSQVTSYASVAVLVGAIHPDTAYAKRMRKNVELRGKDLVEYFDALLLRFAFSVPLRRTLVCIPWYKFKLYETYTDVPYYEDHELDPAPDESSHDSDEGGHDYGGDDDIPPDPEEEGSTEYAADDPQTNKFVTNQEYGEVHSVSSEDID